MAFGLNLHPAAEVRVHIGAKAIEAIGAGFRDSVTRVIGLKDRTKSAGVQRETLPVAAGTTWARAETAAEKSTMQKNAGIDRFMGTTQIHFL